MSTVRRVDASKFRYDDERRYVTSRDCLSEPEVLKVYCQTHPTAVCVGGYGYFGCRPAGKKREDFIKYDLQRRAYVRSDGKTVEIGKTYCGRKLPRRFWNGKEYYENQIWNRNGLGHPDIVDAGMIVEAKGGLPSANKIRTALGQLMSYREHETSFKVGFLFPKVWLEAENLKEEFEVLKKHNIVLLSV